MREFRRVVGEIGIRLTALQSEALLGFFGSESSLLSFDIFSLSFSAELHLKISVGGTLSKTGGRITFPISLNSSWLSRFSDRILAGDEGICD